MTGTEDKRSTVMQRLLHRSEELRMGAWLVKWLVIASLTGILAGSASALFLVSLDWATNVRESNTWIIVMLPLAGLLVGLLYHYTGRDVEAGNNLLIDEIHNPSKVIPFKMAPLVLAGTIVTHLAGGSAGREGTAVQMGGSLADQISHFIRLKPRDRMILLICGISGGFASVFGTPLAGMVFSLEVFFTGKLRYNALFPALMSAVIADYICDAWQIKHTVYQIPFIPEISPAAILWCIAAGIAFGLAGRLFADFTHALAGIFRKYIAWPPLRPFAGGIIVASGVFLLGSTKYIGLGVPAIVAAFSEQMRWYDPLLKIIFTAVTLGAAFKGGEVTPLFFIGATLGSALSAVIPLPAALLAGMGFVAVFSGAANTPLATTIMAAELFGIQAGVFAAIACVVAYLFSGHSGIYGSQVIGEPKHPFSLRETGKKISYLRNRKK